MRLSTADCICISGFWGLCPRLHWGSAPGPQWGLPSSRPPVPTLPPNPSYATSWQYPFHGFYLFINIQWLDVVMTSLISPYSSKTSHATDSQVGLRGLNREIKIKEDKGSRYGTIDDHDKYEWVNVSFGTGSWGLSWTNPRAVKRLCLCVHRYYNVMNLLQAYRHTLYVR